MRLKVCQFDYLWSSDIPLKKLRGLLLNELRKEGEPLRWAITSITTSPERESARKLTIEAVLLNPKEQG